MFTKLLEINFLLEYLLEVNQLLLQADSHQSHGYCFHSDSNYLYYARRFHKLHRTSLAFLKAQGTLIVENGNAFRMLHMVFRELASTSVPALS